MASEYALEKFERLAKGEEDRLFEAIHWLLSGNVERKEFESQLGVWYLRTVQAIAEAVRRDDLMLGTVLWAAGYIPSPDSIDEEAWLEGR